MDAQTPAHGADTELLAMLGDTHQFALEPSVLLGLLIALIARGCVLLAPLIKRTGTHPQTLGNLRNWIAPRGGEPHRA